MKTLVIVEFDNYKSCKKAYRFSFNGKENDNEVKNDGGHQDYGVRVYDPRLGRFLSVDPLTITYPFYTPFQFASNCPISGIDLDGLEYFYAADGSFLGKVGISTQVYLVKDKDVEVVKTTISQVNEIEKKMNFVTRNNGLNFVERASFDAKMETLMSSSSVVGMTNDELMVRAALDVMQKYEGGNSYYKWSGGETFDNSDINDGHPGKSPKKNLQAAGAYQIQLATWNDEYVGQAIRENYGIKDFSPENQDRFTIGLIKDKSKAFEALKSGDYKTAYSKMAGVWRFLPGPKQQGNLSLETLLKDTKNAVSQELNGNTKVKTEKGKLLNGF